MDSDEEEKIAKQLQTAISKKWAADKKRNEIFSQLKNDSVRVDIYSDEPSRIRSKTAKKYKGVRQQRNTRRRRRPKIPRLIPHPTKRYFKTKTLLYVRAWQH